MKASDMTWIDCDVTIKLRKFDVKFMENTRHCRMGGTRSSEGVEHEVLSQDEHDGHVNFLANQILFY
jgi:hypothetical protein